VLPSDFTVATREWPTDDQPFAADAAPIQLQAKARRVPEWTLDSKGLIHEVQPSPVRTTQPEETITLIPMGAARLRITAFPVAGSGPEANGWVMPAPSPITASHCYEHDCVEAVHDGVRPRDSADRESLRFTWRPNRGTDEWLQWTFAQPRPVARVEVYWCEDNGRVPCRTPAECRVEYRAGGAWQAVPGADAVGLEKDRFNVVTFAPVTADALRLVVRLRAGFSGGVLEWRIPEL
jgi:hypothetical protein